VEAPSEEQQPEPIPLTEPAGGVPPVIETPEALAKAAAAVRAGTGPIAVDTERASGYRYSQRAYLIQLRRAGAGTMLVDPVALRGDVAVLAEAMDGPEWVLHAASQDLPCLAEVGLRPTSLFDTELAGRLAGYDRVALGTMVQLLLGYKLEKGHSAADWSRRPLPEDWLVYAALDVELLVELRDLLETELRDKGKLDWALEEFEAVRTAGPKPPRAEPWRRASGIHKARTPRQLAAVRELWQAREELAKRRDIAPGRVLPDSAVLQASVEDPGTIDALTALPVFRGRAQRRSAGVWLAALTRARDLTKDRLPESSPAQEGPPAPSRWADREPDAAARLSAAREALAALAKEHGLPVENLLLPDLVRRVCWQPPEHHDLDTVTDTLRTGGAREWQITLAAGAIATALDATAPTRETTE
jgi:ribonuclease D